MAASDLNVWLRNLLDTPPLDKEASTPTLRSSLDAALGGSGAAGFVVEGPTASTDNVIQPTGAAVVPLTVQGFAGQTADLQQWQDSAGAVLAKVDSGGSITLAVNQGVRSTYLTDPGNTTPYIQFTSSNITVVNRTTASNIPLIVKGMASQSGNLQQWQDSAGTVLAYVNAAGNTKVSGLGVGVPAASAATSAYIPVLYIDSFNSYTGGPGGVAVQDGLNFAVGTTTGTKIGTATTQKIGFFNKTPIVQPAAIASPTSDAVGTKAAIDAIRVALTNLGLTA